MSESYYPTSSIAWTHAVNNEVHYSSLVTDPLLKTVRTCVVSFVDTASLAFSGGVRNFTHAFTTANVSENCVIEKSTLLYLDTVRGIAIWRYEKQTLVFDLDFDTTGITNIGGGGTYADCIGLIKAHPEKDPMTSRLLIPADVNISCEEAIYATTPKGIKQTLVAAHTYTKNAFAGLNSEDPYWPQVDSSDDGGTDLFYPYWCRQMLYDPLWEQSKAKRFSAGEPAYNSGINTWTPIEIPIDPTPIGSITYNTQGDFIASLVFSMHDGVDHLFNDSNIASVYGLLLAAGAEGTTNTCYPISLL